MSSIDSLIESVARSVGWATDPPVVTALARFGALFLRWNQSINLASVASPEELVERHFLDSFTAADFVTDSARVADVGSGGGLPSIPLALLRPNATMDLFEPNRKKVAFLRTAVRELQLTSRVRVHPEPVESPVAVEHRSRYDVAMSRATLAPAAWLALGRELVSANGCVIVFATIHSEVDLPQPSHAVSYGRNRRLLLFAATDKAGDVPRETQGEEQGRTPASG